MANIRLTFSMSFVACLGMLFFIFQNVNLPNIKLDNSNIKNNLRRNFWNTGIYSFPSTTTFKTTGNFRKEAVIPEHLIQVSTWLPVDDQMIAFVFSAYYVADKRAVYVIGARLRSTHEMVCRLWFCEDSATVVNVTETKAKIVSPQEGVPNDSPYTSTIFECPVQGRAMPSYVSIVKNFRGQQLNLLIVTNATTPKEYKFNYTVCLSPMFNFGRANEVVEWIELNRILGADKFVFFDHSTTESVQQVLEYYSKLGIVDAVRWRPEMRVNRSFLKPIPVHYHAQTASINDCLYRSKHSSKFIVNVDLDELIIPHLNNAKTWFDMLSELNQNKAAYIFRSTFFGIERKEKTFQANMTPATKLNLVTLNNFEHEKRIFPYPQRTKYIARTKDINCALIHVPHRGNQLCVDPTVGLVHHYRNSDTKNWLSTGVKDFTVMVKYGEELIKRVSEVWSDLGK